MRRARRGFTLPELIVVMGVIATLVGIASVSLLGVQHKSLVNTTRDTIVADIKFQQLKAMTGDTEGRGTPDKYGVYLAPHQYTLFHGAAFSSSNPDNVVVSMNQGVTLTTAFPSSTIVFLNGSGEIQSFVSGADILTLSGTDGTSKTVKLNKYGVIIQDQ